MTAFAHDHSRFEDLPERFRRDQDFFLEAVRKKSLCWHALPNHFKSDPEFVENFESFDNDDVVAAVFDAIPALCNDRDIWNTIIASRCDLKLAPVSIRSDRDFMMKACVINASFLRYLSENLARDRDFVQQVIDMNVMALHYVSHEQFPELIIDTLERFFAIERNHFGSNLLYFIDPDVRTVPSFVKSWFTLGGAFWAEYFPESMRDDKEIVLALAEKGPETSFEHASDRVKSDYAFVTQIVELQPHAKLACESGARHLLDRDCSCWLRFLCKRFPQVIFNF